MADFAEYTRVRQRALLDAVLPSSTTGGRWLWADTVAEACKRGGVPDCVAFFRSIYLGSPKSAP